MYVEKNDRKTMISEKTKHTSCILKRNFINVGSKITNPLLKCKLDAVGSLGILKGKQNLGVTSNFNKQDVIDFTKFSKMIMCRASEANS